MSIDSVLAIGRRIDEIRSLVAAPVAARDASTSSATFAAALAQALAGEDGGLAAGVWGLLPDRTASATSDVAATLDKAGVPVDLAGYGNGRIPESALVQIPGSSERMWGPAAQALGRLRDAAAADGISIGVTDGYRSYDAQADLVRRKGLYSQGGLAAAPGTSQHGWGLAVDLALDPAALTWMRANAGRFGFAETTPRETWHWEYSPA